MSGPSSPPNEGPGNVLPLPLELVLVAYLLFAVLPFPFDFIGGGLMVLVAYLVRKEP